MKESMFGMQSAAEVCDDDYDLPPEALQVTIEDVVTEIWYDSAYNVIRRFTYTYQRFAFDGSQNLYEFDMLKLRRTAPPYVHDIKWILKRFADNNEDAFCLLSEAISYRKP